jgi:hypothetical protein
LILAENHQELVEVNRARLVLVYRPYDLFENFQFNLDAKLIFEQRLQLFGIDAARAIFVKLHEGHTQFILSHFADVRALRCTGRLIRRGRIVESK